MKKIIKSILALFATLSILAGAQAFALDQKLNCVQVLEVIKGFHNKTEFAVKDYYDQKNPEIEQEMGKFGCLEIAVANCTHCDGAVLVFKFKDASSASSILNDIASDFGSPVLADGKFLIACSIGFDAELYYQIAEAVKGMSSSVSSSVQGKSWSDFEFCAYLMHELSFDGDYDYLDYDTEDGSSGIELNIDDREYMILNSTVSELTDSFKKMASAEGFFMTKFGKFLIATEDLESMGLIKNALNIR